MGSAVVGGGGGVSATGISTVSITFGPVRGLGGSGGAEATGTADTLVDSEAVSVLGIFEAGCVATSLCCAREAVETIGPVLAISCGLCPSIGMFSTLGTIMTTCPCLVGVTT